MRKFQRAAVVAAVVAGLSTFGGGVGFADDSDDPHEVSAIASAQANAVVTWEAPYIDHDSDSRETQHQATHEQKHPA